jgi:hypothetical protein
MLKLTRNKTAVAMKVSCYWSYLHWLSIKGYIVDESLFSKKFQNM